MTTIRHGYTLADLHNLARLAVHTAGTAAADWHERYDTAWSAIAEHLYTAEHWLPRHDLVRAGQLAIYAAVDDTRHHHGYYRHKNIGAAAGPCSSPAFIRYWWDLCGALPTQSPEPGIVERAALAQILRLLTPRQQEALIALAVHDDYQTAADGLGMPYATFKGYVADGRRRFLGWWHEGEAPSRVWGCDRRAGSTTGTRRRSGTAMAAVRRRKPAPTSREADR